MKYSWTLTGHRILPGDRALIKGDMPIIKLAYNCLRIKVVYVLVINQ